MHTCPCHSTFILIFDAKNHLAQIKIKKHITALFSKDIFAFLSFAQRRKVLAFSKTPFP